MNWIDRLPEIARAIEGCRDRGKAVYIASRIMGRKVSWSGLEQAFKRAMSSGLVAETAYQVVMRSDEPAVDDEWEEKTEPGTPVIGVELANKARTQKVHEYRGKLKVALDELRDTQILLDTATYISDVRTEPTPIVRAPSRRMQATAVVLASDWHVEEYVDPETVNRRNEYNLDIARRRAQRFWEGVAWLVEHHRERIDIDRMMLNLLGDLMTGYIHEELEESNLLSPNEVVLFLIELIEPGIMMLHRDLGLQVHVVCTKGNHGRTTKKRRISTGHKNSWEWLLYKILAQRFDGIDGVEFTIADGDHVYTDVYGYMVRSTHGDNFNYGGGVGGLSIPLLKGIQRLETFHHADYTVLGHFHQQRDFESALVNGSLIGYNAYAVKINAPFEAPRQTFFLIEPDHGKCMVTPIWVE